MVLGRLQGAKMDYVFAVRQVCEKYLAEGKGIFLGYMDLEILRVRLINVVCGRCKECVE